MAALLLTLGCASNSSNSTGAGNTGPGSTGTDAADTAQADRVLVVGRLEGGMMAIGGEHTGWVLHIGEEAIEVDVSAVPDQAEALNGRVAAISGTYTTKPYIERGPTKILVAKDIRSGW